MATGIEEYSFEAVKWLLYLYEKQIKSDLPQRETCCGLQFGGTLTFSGMEIRIWEFVCPHPNLYLNSHFFTELRKFHFSV